MPRSTSSSYSTLVPPDAATAADSSTDAPSTPPVALKAASMPRTAASQPCCALASLSTRVLLHLEVDHPVTDI